MKVAQRPELLHTVVVGTAVTMAGYVVAFLCSSALATFIYNGRGQALDPTNPWIVFGFAAASWPAYLGLAVGGRGLEDVTAQVSAAAASLLAVALSATGLLLLPDAIVVQLLSSVVICALLGGSSMPGEFRRGLGGAIGGGLAGIPLGLMELGRETFVEWASANWAYGTETNAAVELSTLLVQAGCAGLAFWILVPLGERLLDR